MKMIFMVEFPNLRYFPCTKNWTILKNCEQTQQIQGSDFEHPRIEGVLYSVNKCNLRVDIQLNLSFKATVF